MGMLGWARRTALNETLEKEKVREPEGKGGEDGKDQRKEGGDGRGTEVWIAATFWETKTEESTARRSDRRSVALMRSRQ
jgi:hypothetical protein